jgi:hypothetical protein
VKSSAESDARRIRIMDADGLLRVNNIVKRAAEQADGGNLVVTAPSTLGGCCPAPSSSICGRRWAGSLAGSHPRVDFRLRPSDDKIFRRMRLWHANSASQTASAPGCSKLLVEGKEDLEKSR